jgi:hypothetical protein
MARAQPKTKKDGEDDRPTTVFLETEAVKVMEGVPDMTPTRREGKGTQNLAVRTASMRSP